MQSPIPQEEIDLNSTLGMQSGEVPGHLLPNHPNISL